jgi:DNA-binding beta-propeller fold protein YncE
MRWPKGAITGSLIVGGHGVGSASDQLNYPSDLSFDRYGNLYVTDTLNNRVQKFIVDKSSCHTNKEHTFSLRN